MLDACIMKKKRPSFLSVNKICPRLLMQLGGDKYHDFIKAYLAWKGIVGELLASHSHPIKYEHGVLFVAVFNNTWMQELVLLKPEIKKKYANLLEEGINEIVFLISSPKRKCKKHK